MIIKTILIFLHLYMCWYLPSAVQGWTGLPRELCLLKHGTRRLYSINWPCCQYLSMCIEFTYFRKHKIDAEPNAMRKSTRNSSWTLIETRLVTKTMSTVVKILYIFGISGIVPVPRPFAQPPPTLCAPDARLPPAPWPPRIYIYILFFRVFVICFHIIFEYPYELICLICIYR